MKDGIANDVIKKIACSRGNAEGSFSRPVSLFDQHINHYVHVDY